MTNAIDVDVRTMPHAQTCVFTARGACTDIRVFAALHFASTAVIVVFAQHRGSTYFYDPGCHCRDVPLQSYGNPYRC